MQVQIPMSGLEAALYQQMNVLSNVYLKMNCRNTAEFLRKNIGIYDRDFLSQVLKSLYSDIRTVKFADEICLMNSRLIGIMRKSTISSLDLLLDKLSVQPSKMSRYRRIGMMPFDVERNWFLNRFNNDVQKMSEKLPRPAENPELFVRKVFGLYTSFVKNIHNPYSDLYKFCMKNVLGTNAKHLPALIEENFCLFRI